MMHNNRERSRSKGCQTIELGHLRFFLIREKLQNLHLSVSKYHQGSPTSVKCTHLTPSTRSNEARIGSVENKACIAKTQTHFMVN